MIKTFLFSLAALAVASFSTWSAGGAVCAPAAAANSARVRSNVMALFMNVRFMSPIYNKPVVPVRLLPILTF